MHSNLRQAILGPSLFILLGLRKLSGNLLIQLRFRPILLDLGV